MTNGSCFLARTLQNLNLYIKFQIRIMLKTNRYWILVSGCWIWGFFFQDPGSSAQFRYASSDWIYNPSALLFEAKRIIARMPHSVV
jgi:hypothetical protein